MNKRKLSDSDPEKYGSAPPHQKKIDQCHGNAILGKSNSPSDVENDDFDMHDDQNHIEQDVQPDDNNNIQNDEESISINDMDEEDSQNNEKDEIEDITIPQLKGDFENMLDLITRDWNIYTSQNEVWLQEEKMDETTWRQVMKEKREEKLLLLIDAAINVSYHLKPEYLTGTKYDAILQIGIVISAFDGTIINNYINLIKQNIRYTWIFANNNYIPSDMNEYGHLFQTSLGFIVLALCRLKNSNVSTALAALNEFLIHAIGPAYAEISLDRREPLIWNAVLSGASSSGKFHLMKELLEIMDEGDELFREELKVRNYYHKYQKMFSVNKASSFSKVTRDGVFALGCKQLFYDEQGEFVNLLELKSGSDNKRNWTSHVLTTLLGLWHPSPLRRSFMTENSSIGCEQAWIKSYHTTQPHLSKEFANKVKGSGWNGRSIHHKTGKESWNGVSEMFSDTKLSTKEIFDLNIVLQHWQYGLLRHKFGTLTHNIKDYINVTLDNKNKSFYERIYKMVFLLKKNLTLLEEEKNDNDYDIVRSLVQKDLDKLLRVLGLWTIANDTLTEIKNNKKISFDEIQYEYTITNIDLHYAASMLIFRHSLPNILDKLGINLNFIKCEINNKDLEIKLNNKYSKLIGDKLSEEKQDNNNNNMNNDNNNNIDIDEEEEEEEEEEDIQFDKNVLKNEFNTLTNFLLLPTKYIPLSVLNKSATLGAIYNIVPDYITTKNKEKEEKKKFKNNPDNKKSKFISSLPSILNIGMSICTYWMDMGLGSLYKTNIAGCKFLFIKNEITDNALEVDEKILQSLSSHHITINKYIESFNKTQQWKIHQSDVKAHGDVNKLLENINKFINLESDKKEIYKYNNNELNQHISNSRIYFDYNRDESLAWQLQMSNKEKSISAMYEEDNPNNIFIYEHISRAFNNQEWFDKLNISLNKLSTLNIFNSKKVISAIAISRIKYRPNIKLKNISSVHVDSKLNRRMKLVKDFGEPPVEITDHLLIPFKKDPEKYRQMRQVCKDWDLNKR